MEPTARRASDSPRCRGHGARGVCLLHSTRNSGRARRAGARRSLRRAAAVVRQRRDVAAGLQRLSSVPRTENLPHRRPAIQPRRSGAVSHDRPARALVSAARRGLDRGLPSMKARVLAPAGILLLVFIARVWLAGAGSTPDGQPALVDLQQHRPAQGRVQPRLWENAGHHLRSRPRAPIA